MDFGAPVVADTPPPSGIQTISQLMGLRQQAQALQIGQSHIATAAAQAQVQQATVPAHIAQIVAQSRQAATQALTTRFHLNQSQGEAAVNLSDGLINDPRVASGDPQQETEAIRQRMTLALNMGIPADKVTAIFNPLLQEAQSAPGMLRQRMLARQVSVMNAIAQHQAMTPSGVPVTSGAVSQTVNTNPTAGPIGSPIPGTVQEQVLAPAARTDVVTGTTGQPYAVVRPPSGVGASIAPVPGAAGGAQPGAPAPGWPTAPVAPSLMQAQAATNAIHQIDTIRAADSNPTTGYQASRQVYTTLLHLVAKDPAIGPQSHLWNDVTGVLTPFGVSPNASMQEVGAYLDRLALQNASYAGLNTDAARSMIENSTGSTNMNPQALAEKLRFGAATLAASHAYREGLDAVVGMNNQNPYAKAAFDSEWAKNADINAFRLLAEKQDGDTAGLEQTLAQIRKMPKSSQYLLYEHMQNLNKLVKGEPVQ